MHLHECLDQSVEVIIMSKDDESLDICKTCWTKIAEKGRVEPDIEHEIPKPLFGCN